MYNHTIYKYTWLSRPSRINMKKKQIDQNGAAGISATAAGYTMNAKPGPDGSTKTHAYSVFDVNHYHTRYGTYKLLFCQCCDSIGWVT